MLLVGLLSHFRSCRWDGRPTGFMVCLFWEMTRPAPDTGPSRGSTHHKKNIPPENPEEAPM